MSWTVNFRAELLTEIARWRAVLSCRRSTLVIDDCIQRASLSAHVRSLAVLVGLAQLSDMVGLHDLVHGGSHRRHREPTLVVRVPDAVRVVARTIAERYAPSSRAT